MIRQAMWTTNRADWALASALVLFTSVIFGLPLNVGEFWWTDESRHAMDGVYMLDLMRDLPVNHLYDYTVRYFAQYPALALNWYPPFFAFIEGLMFAAIGFSEFSARATVFLFCLVGILTWYFWAGAVWGRWVAFGSGLLFLTNPQVVIWTRSVMLETPSLVMMLFAVVSFSHYLKNPTTKSSLMTGVILGCGLLLKQTVAMILPVLLLYALFTGSGDRLWRREALWAYVIISGVLFALAIHAVKLGSLGLGVTLGNIGEEDGLSASKMSWARWTLYLDAIVEVYSWPILAAALAGILVILIRERRPEDLLILLWIGIWYVFCTLLKGFPGDSIRYTVYATLPIGVLACRGLAAWPARHKVYQGWFVLLVAVLGWHGFQAINEPHPYISAYEKTARMVLANHDGGTILFGGRHDGNFIFHIRKQDPLREHIVLRADKVLVSMAIQKSFGIKSYVKDSDDIYKKLDEYGVRTIVVENRDLVGLPEFGLLNATVRSDRFRLLAQLPVESNIPNYAGLSLLVYRYLESKKKGDEFLTIPLPHMGREIRFQVQPRR